jgi:hypothetical protein
MPENDVISRAKRDAKQGKAPSTQAGEFVREEIRHVREGVHGAQSAKQAIAIGLSKGRRAGIKLPPPKRGGHLQEFAARLYVTLQEDAAAHTQPHARVPAPS